MKHLISRRFVTLVFLVLLVSGSSPGSTGMLEPLAVAPAGPVPDGAIRVLTWNVAHGRADAFHQAFLGREKVEENLASIARVLEREQPDVVALQEADGPSTWSGGFDHVAELGRLSRLSYQVRGDHNPFDVGSLSLDSGTALVSRLPIAEADSEPFGLAPWDTKGFVVATVLLPGSEQEVDVVSVHLDPIDPGTRREQVRALVATLAERRALGRSLVVLGDLNCDGGDERTAVEMLQTELDLIATATSDPTFPASAPLRRIDWVLVSPDLEIVSQRTLPDRLSDHLGVVAEIRLADDAGAGATALGG